MQSPAIQPKADESTRVISPPTKPAASAPAAAAAAPAPMPGAAAARPAGPPPAPGVPGGVMIPKSPLLQGPSPSEGPVKRRLVAGKVVAGSVAALLLFGNFTSTTTEVDADSPVDATDGSAAPVNHVASKTPPVGDLPVVISTDRPVAETLMDDLTIEDARDIARAEVGTDGFFKWHGQVHTTTGEEEFKTKTEEDRADFVGNITWHENHSAGQSSVLNGLAVNVEVNYLEKVGEWSMYRHDDATTGKSKYYLGDAEGNGIPLENVSKDEWGNMVRTDPETQEVTPFTPTTILEQVADGKIDAQFYPSDVEIVDYYPSVEPLDVVTIDPNDFYVDPYTDLICDGIKPVGYDGVPTKPDHELNPVQETESELISNKLHEIADEAGIDDPTKIKMKQDGDDISYKIKGEDGEKIKGHISVEELREDEAADIQDVQLAHATPAVVETEPNSDSYSSHSTTAHNEAYGPDIHSPYETGKSDYDAYDNYNNE